eukprot:m.38297 g.38297  ORF g.38297 m.38297 type:complete len:394 (-) comp7801_c0_seq1:2222-3403(-)
MSKLEPIEKEFAKLRKRKRNAVSTMSEAIDEMVKVLSQCKGEIVEHDAGSADSMDVDESAPRESTAAAVQTAIKGITAAHSKIRKAQKEATSSLSKYGKAVDKTFEGSITKLTATTLSPGPDLDFAIADHLLRLGRWSLAQQFVATSEADIGETRLEGCRETHSILDAMEQRQLGPALAWVSDNETRLAETGSRLAFLLHRLAFISHVIAGDRAAAVSYAKTYLASYSTTEFSEIQRLLGCLAYSKRLATSPYADYVDPSLWRVVADLYTRESARLSGLPKESPLSVCVDAGCTAIPKLMKVVNLVKKEEALFASDQLPVEIDLGSNRLYHSVFCCPVSRETASSVNPPMRLPCGHVICQDSIRKIAKGARRRFKCPYCPQEATTNEVQRLHF